ncbi:MAG: peptide chain release factor 2, partial [Chloroflexi bacterium]|nr:peptide chain release factor 2 [Chloroflexota bacterium]
MIPFDIEGKKERIKALQEEIGSPDFWQKPEAREKVSLLSKLEEEVKGVEELKGEVQALEELLPLAEED